MYYSFSMSERVNGVLSPAMNAMRRCLQGHWVAELSPEEQATPHYCQHSADTQSQSQCHQCLSFIQGGLESQGVTFKDVVILNALR